MNNNNRPLYTFVVFVFLAFTCMPDAHSQDTITEEELFFELIYRDSTLGIQNSRDSLPEDYQTPYKFKKLSLDELKQLYYNKSMMAFGNLDVRNLGTSDRNNGNIACAIFHIHNSSYIEKLPDGSLKVNKHPDNLEFCGSVSFKNEPRHAIGTAFAISDSSICTAYHYEYPVGEIAFVFDYSLKDTNTIVFTSDRVFYPDKILKYSETNNTDFVIYRVTKAIPSKWFPCSIKIGKAIPDEKIYMVGHPMGWPKKIADNATVRRLNGIKGFTDLDKFVFNSGSPVFSLESHKLIGMLVRGMECDFIRINTDSCIRTRNINYGSPCLQIYSTNYEDTIATIFVDINEILK